MKTVRDCFKTSIFACDIKIYANKPEKCDELIAISGK